MTTLNINGRKVTVDDSFKSLTPDQQNATVDEISQSFGSSSPASAAAPAAQPPAQAKAHDLSGSFNTKLDPKDEANFQEWAGPKIKDVYDYDLRGAWKSGAAASESGHLPDTFKKPNHPTFSKESQYNTPETPGGEWIDKGDGKFAFKPTSYNLDTYGKDALSEYFRGNEPDATLEMSTQGGKPFSGSILPISRDDEGNVGFDSNAGIVGTVKRAFTAPGRAMSGELQVMGPDGSASPEAIAEGGNFALTVGGITTPAAGTGKVLAANAPRQVRPGMEVSAAAQRLEVPLPRAVTSDAGTVQQAGKVIANVPFAGQPLRKAAQESVDALGNAATRTQEGFGSGSVANAGGAAREGIQTYSKALSGKVGQAYDSVDPLITQNVVTPLENTARIASEITAGRTNSRIGPSRAVTLVKEALNTPEGLNYQGIKGLRTSIREMMDTPGLAPAETSQAELKRIYSALSDDLRSSVNRAGGENASKAFESANQLAAKTAREQEGLQKVLGRDISDEALFDRVSAMAGSTSRADRISLARVKGAVGDDTWNEIASGVISKLGRAPDGNFSPDRFVTGWGKLSPEGKTQLFGGKKELSSALDDIATVSSRFKQLNQYANPSGTGQTVLGGAIGSGLIADPITTISSTIGARVLSSVLAKPTSARALAAYSKAYEKQATAPSKASQQAFINTSRAVAAILANEAGNKGLAPQIFPVISTISRLPAEQGNENNGAEEQQSYGATEQLPVLMPNET